MVYGRSRGAVAPRQYCMSRYATTSGWFCLPLASLATSLFLLEVGLLEVGWQLCSVLASCNNAQLYAVRGALPRSYYAMTMSYHDWTNLHDT
jgi:hypothetical protein